VHGQHLADLRRQLLALAGDGVGQPRNPANKNIAAWFERVHKRPSAEASIHPNAKAGGMRA
jgi:glutathione S-transferase